MPASIERFMTPHPRCIEARETVGEAFRLMHALDVRHLPVLRDGRLVGIVSQRDLLRLETLANIDRFNDPVSDAMTLPAYAVPIGRDLAEVVAEMAERKLGCAVVLRGTQVAGMFTTTDALVVLAIALQRPDAL